MILASSCGIGFANSKELTQHLQELEEIEKLFCMLKSELNYTRAPFEEVFFKMSQKINEPYKEWLLNLSESLKKKTRGNFYEIWKISIVENFKQSTLKQDEIEDIKSLGKNLDYIDSISLYLDQLEYKIQHTREEYRLKRKLCQSMGIIGGLFLVILLL